MPGRPETGRRSLQAIAIPFPTIVIDGVFFQIARTGIARVWESLLEEWAKSELARHLVLLDRDGTAPGIEGIRSLVIPRYDYDHTGRDALLLQEICDRENADLFVSSYYTTPITTPSAFIAYDLIPEAMGCDPMHPMWREKRIGIAHASGFLAISEHTANDLARFYPPLSREFVSVCPLGVGKGFAPAGVEEILRFRHRHGLAQPYFLTVGDRVGVNGYKNTALFFRAFGQMPGRERFRVVCAGGEPELEKQLRFLAGDTRVSVIRLSDGELRAAYAGAAALVYPSKYEGFGLPVLEAMACGCPVITCRNSALTEVAGDAAVYVNESNHFDMIAALQRVQQFEARQALVHRGLERAQHFTWSKSAARFAWAFEEIAITLRQAPHCLPGRSWISYRQLQSRSQEAQAKLADMGPSGRWTMRGIYLRGKVRALRFRGPSVISGLTRLAGTTAKSRTAI